ncbi:MAG TPA: hypothetical protein VHB21_04685 [Minicystis sp.]|nr:hypothetical protein [Minicystis sp.]
MTLTTEQMRDLAEVNDREPLVEPTEEAQEAEASAAPAVAAPTGGPNRATFYVPFDHTTFSMGQAGPAWIPDKGISAKTDNHIHWFVVGTTAETDNTLVTLGSPATAHSIPSHVGNLSSGSIHGYAMVTSGNAWHDSKLQHVIMSREHDVTIRTAGEARAVGIQADQGKVLVFGKENVTIGSPDAVKIGAHPDITKQNIGYEASWASTWVDNIGSKIGSTLSTIGEIVTSAMGLQAVMAGTLVQKGDEDGMAGWTAKKLGSPAKVIADLTLFTSSFVRGAMELVGYEPAGSVGISAQKFMALTAGIGATMYGQVAAAVVSATQAQLLGGVSAVVKGLAWTEIAGGIGTALTSLKDIEIAAGKGEIEMSAHKTVFITSEGEHVVITAKETAQLTSAEGHAAVHGKESAYLGASPAAEGFGVLVKENEIHIGKSTSANNLKTPAFDAFNEFVIKEGAINCAIENTRLQISKESIDLRATEIKLDVDGISMHVTKSGKIMLG